MPSRSCSSPESQACDNVSRGVYARFRLTAAALPHLRSGSAIINTASVQAYQPSPHLLDYAVSKAAIVAFTHGLAQHSRPRASGSTPSPQARSVFLAFKEAAYITGEIVNATGGTPLP